MQIIDISRDIMTTEIYPGDPVPKMQLINRMDMGDECNLTAIYTGLHCGTHIDAPLHFLEDGAEINRFPLELFVGDCTVIEVPAGPITGEYVENKFPRSKPRLLVKSSGEAWFMESAAFSAVENGVKLLGTDALSVGTSGAQGGTHRAFLGADVALLEGLDLSEVEPGDYFLVAQPLKIKGAEASLTRAILIKDYIFWSGR